ncbi:hypothetical protein KUV26_19950 [Leisingera daeponensis]|uniref:Uncharacterized protein n=1 Tax=Leisingera daeponensis TaxID=405746 RepID=A0ABS7NKK4_9RHOB|nr:hypothetical protein [Leisingera daeponensis]MBY6058344.1 hypothetical protein [Leisingera daeponensis]MBY6141722.1 hypothetical protein [Leisingera daeponensis]
MHTFETGPQEAGAKQKANERENERAALEAAINYAIQCARETDFPGAGDSLEKARLDLSRAILT